MGPSVPGVRFELLGQLRAWCGDEELALGWPKQQAVLAVLLLHPNRMVDRSSIVDAVWGDDPPPSATNLVHTYVRRLRRVLEPDRAPRGAGRLLVGSGSGYVLRLAAGQRDVDLFVDHLRAARRGLSDGDLARAVAAFDAALALWRGAPLTGIAGPLAGAERVRLSELRLAAVEDRAAAVLGLGRHAGLVAELFAATAEHPLRERLRGLLMIALYRSGRQADALAVFTETRRLLVAELGVEPGAELRRLHYDILNNRDPGAVPDAGPPDRPGRDTRLVPRQLPPAPPHFAGRARELDALAAVVAEAAGTVVISAIDGTAGIGKTALAVFGAHRLSDRFPDGQLYVNLRGFDPAGSPMEPAEAVRGFLEALVTPPDRIPTSLHAQVGLYRSALADRRMLIVLDNAATAEQVRPLLPGSPGCLVVVTSRHRLTSLVAAEGARPLALGLLSPVEARDLLARRLGAPRLAAEPNAVEEIVVRCARLALALAIVAAHAATHPQLPLATLAAQLCAGRGGLDAFDAGDPVTNLRAVFSWSYRRLGADAAWLFRLLGLHSGADLAVPAAASLAGVPVARVRPVLAELAGAHLVEESAPDRFACHDLLRAYAGELAHSTESTHDRRAAVHRILDHYLHTAAAAALLLNPYREPVALADPRPGVTPGRFAHRGEALAWLTAEHRNLSAAIRQAAGAGLDTHTWQLAWSLSGYLDYRGRWQDWADVQHAALEATRRLADRPGQARTHRVLGLIHARLGRATQAHTHLREALTLYDELGDRVGQAHTHHNVARIHERQGSYTDALRHTQQALDLYRAANHPNGHGRALNGVGWYHCLLGDYRQALVHCGQALTLLTEIGDPQGESAALDSLGYAHHHLGHHREALDCYRRALDIGRELGDRPSEADMLSRLGDTYHASGDLDAAVDSWRSALAVFEELGDPQANQIRARLRDLADHPPKL